MLLKKIIPYLIILFAFFLQTRYLAELQQIFPDSFGRQPFCGVDAYAHLARAAGLLDGSIPGNNPFFFIPLYPLYLAVFRNFFGESLLLPIFSQALLQLVGIAALYRLGWLAFSRLTGALAALGLATYNYYLFYIPCFDQTLLTTPFLTLAVLFLLQYDRRQESRYLLATGLALAVTALSRPTMLIVFPVVIIWLYFDFRRHRDETVMSKKFMLITSSRRSFIKNVIFLTLPFLIAVAPITWHNYRVTGRFILLTSNFGVNIFTGNNPDATGLDSLAHIQSQPAVVRFEEVYAQVKRDETTLAAEVARYIVEQPGDWLALTATKTWLWLGEIDERLVSPFFPLAVSQSRTLAPFPLEWQAMIIAALFGIALASMHARSQRRIYLLGLIYAAFSVATIIFFIQLRFRLPFAAFVILAAASFLTSAPHLHRRYPRLFWIILAALLLLYPLVPTLWIFILLFMGLGLWLRPSLNAQSNTGHQTDKPLSETPLANQQMTKPRFRRYFLLVFLCCVYLLTVGLWVRAETLASDISQTIDHYLGPPLAASAVLGQTFQMDCNGLNRIEVTLGVFNNRHNQPVTFYLATDTSAQEILFSETFDGNSVRDYQKKRFSFSPIADSAGRTYFFFITSPTSTLENAITARGYADIPLDRYPAGSAFAGQLELLQQLEADFAFEASCEMSLWDKVWTGITD